MIATDDFTYCESCGAIDSNRSHYSVDVSWCSECYGSEFLHIEAGDEIPEHVEAEL